MLLTSPPVAARRRRGSRHREKIPPPPPQTHFAPGPIASMNLRTLVLFTPSSAPLETLPTHFLISSEAPRLVSLRKCLRCAICQHMDPKLFFCNACKQTCPQSLKKLIAANVCNASSIPCSFILDGTTPISLNARFRREETFRQERRS